LDHKCLRIPDKITVPSFPDLSASKDFIAGHKLPLLLRAGRIGLFCTIKGRETSAHFPAQEMASAADLQLPASPGASFGGARLQSVAFDLRQGKG